MWQRKLDKLVEKSPSYYECVKVDGIGKAYTMPKRFISFRSKEKTVTLTYAFYRVPKELFLDERFAGLSTEAKLLYGMMLDHMEISMKHGWTNKEGRVYIYFTMDEAMELCNVKRKRL